jgi:hypothetical protein
MLFKQIIYVYFESSVINIDMLRWQIRVFLVLKKETRAETAVL